MLETDVDYENVDSLEGIKTVMRVVRDVEICVPVFKPRSSIKVICLEVANRVTML